MATEIVEIVDKYNHRVSVDSDINGLVIINGEHHKIHEGNSYVSSNTIDLGNSASHNIIIHTPNEETEHHLLFDLDTEAECSYIIYEDITVSASLSGTQISSINRNRNSTKTSNVINYQGALTGNINRSGATTILDRHLGSSRNIGGTERALNEFEFKPNKKYNIRVLNEVTTNNFIGYVINWYEVK